MPTNPTTANRQLWNAWTRQHRDASFYDVAGFKAGATRLQALELAELGDVRGKTLLHLQCHFGLDTLSLARNHGAVVTGVDLSDEAIRTARALRDELAIPARFVCCDVYDLPQHVPDERFDVVFTSYGVLCWLPDLDRWAALVARYLKPGGVFYMVEFHPLIEALDETGRLARPYFGPEPVEGHYGASYAAEQGAAGTASTHVAYEWRHPVGEVVTALIGAGLHLEFLHEHATMPYDCFPHLEEHAPGQYGLRGRPNVAPLLYSVRARLAG